MEYYNHKSKKTAFTFGTHLLNVRQPLSTLLVLIKCVNKSSVCNCVLLLVILNLNI